MEVLLNTIWVLLVLGAFIAWWPERNSALARNWRNVNFLAVLALAFASLMLFPVISLTDDLHAEQYPMEDSTRSATKTRHLERGGVHADHPSLLAAVPGAASPRVRLNLVLGLVMSVAIYPFCLSLTSSRQGRSPPSGI